MVVSACSVEGFINKRHKGRTSIPEWWAPVCYSYCELAAGLVRLRNCLGCLSCCLSLSRDFSLNLQDKGEKPFPQLTWDLMLPMRKKQEVENFKKLNLISKEQFENLTPELPFEPNQEVPVAPSQSRQDLTDELAQKLFVVSEIPSATMAYSLPTAVPESPRIYPARTPKTPRTPRLQDPNKTPRFYPVVKEPRAIDVKSPRKRKTRHSTNPPLECHVGWVMDSRDHGPRTSSVRYGLECLFRFYSYGLEKKFRQEIFKDFQEETKKDYESGQLYGLEKFWAYLKYSQSKTQSVDPKLQEYLCSFKRLEDFRVDVLLVGGMSIERTGQHEVSVISGALKTLTHDSSSWRDLRQTSPQRSHHCVT
ncbi:La-related protein 1B [Pteropus alecto]|uniref:La-related protein 1B n=1 Tax=Pteropus alecto TaxID=9402 RepID=L5KA48_PTEAL|nr:La-related protein 1B [Pteropus alecto]